MRGNPAASRQAVPGAGPRAAGRNPGHLTGQNADRSGHRVRAGELETAINEADRLGLVDPDNLRAATAARTGKHGVRTLRNVLDRHTFSFTGSELERRFLRLVRRAALPRPLTQQRVNGFRVDFYWPELGLVVETDGLWYHRTPAQQSRDKTRDQSTPPPA